VIYEPWGLEPLTHNVSFTHSPSDMRLCAMHVSTVPASMLVLGHVRCRTMQVYPTLRRHFYVATMSLNKPHPKAKRFPQLESHHSAELCTSVSGRACHKVSSGMPCAYSGRGHIPSTHARQHLAHRSSYGPHLPVGVVTGRSDLRSAKHVLRL